MMNFTVLLAANETLTFGERASTAGIVTLQGMLTVFLVLAILWGAIEVMHRVIHKESDKKEQRATASADEGSHTQDAAVVAALAASIAASEDDGATVAAITAAITAARAEEGLTGNFRVVSFKRVQGAGMHKKL